MYNINWGHRRSPRTTDGRGQGRLWGDDPSRNLLCRCLYISTEPLRPLVVLVAAVAAATARAAAAARAAAVSAARAVAAAARAEWTLSLSGSRQILPTIPNCL